MSPVKYEKKTLIGINGNILLFKNLDLCLLMNDTIFLVGCCCVHYLLILGGGGG